MKASTRKGFSELRLGRGGSGKTHSALAALRVVPGPGVVIAYGGDCAEFDGWTGMTPAEWHERGMPDCTVWQCPPEEALTYGMTCARLGKVRGIFFDEAHRFFSKDLGTPEQRALAVRWSLERRHIGAYVSFGSQRPQGLMALEEETDYIAVHYSTSRYLRNTVLPEYDHPKTRVGFPSWTRGMTLGDVVYEQQRMCHSFIEIDLRGNRGGLTRWNGCPHVGEASKNAT